MVPFLHIFSRYRKAALPALAAIFLLGCSREPLADKPAGEVVRVPVNISAQETRAFADDLSHHVNRVLLLPFRKTAEGLPDDDANFVPAYRYALQTDAASFPLTSATLHLPTATTYKILVIGYNRNDYNYADPTNPANKFVIAPADASITLANAYLALKSATDVPEFFSCICQTGSGSQSFLPEEGISVSGDLKRLVSGFSVTVNNIPDFVKSITLKAENLVKASRCTDGSPVLWQSTGDGENRILGTMIPSAGSVAFESYLLPTLSAHKTGFTLSVEYGLYTEDYSVKVPDGAVVSGNKLIFNPNEAINLTADYARINIGFSIRYGINLDDGSWDGLQ